MRASDIDRELTVDLLKAAFMQGRLTKDELSERVGRALAARTYTDLNFLTADIPRDLAAPAPRLAATLIQAPAAASVGLHHASVRDRAFVATALLSGLAILAAFLLNDGALSGLLALIGVLSGLFSMTLVAAYIRDAQRDRHRGGVPPPNRTSGTGPRLARPAARRASRDQPGLRGTTGAIGAFRVHPRTFVVALIGSQGCLQPAM
jgi:hypothetical protein